jgi:undecaprenyl-diphosphatase
MDLIFQAAIIGALQGLTEFLPLSSSAHLIVVPPLLGWNDPFINSAAFDVMLHAGTLVALLLYFWRDVLALLAAGWAALRERSLKDDPQRRLAAFLVVSVIPAAILGALGESFFDEYFRERLLLVPLLMVVGALILAAAEWYGRRQRTLDGLTIGDSISIGVAQTLALFPGISRSGITIATGLFRGLERESAARFAFLMGIPVIGGATIWKMRTLVAAPPSSADFAALIVGMVVSAVVGVLAIGVLLRYLRTNTTAIFILYRLVFAVVVGALLIAR